MRRISRSLDGDNEFLLPREMNFKLSGERGRMKNGIFHITPEMNSSSKGQKGILIWANKSLEVTALADARSGTSA